jgi:dolichol-phosphate mannosyltransferase
MAPNLSIVVAVYNEDPRNLLMMLDRLRNVIPPIGLTYEVIFVNDGSRAKTSQALREIATQADYVKLVVLSRNFGQQAAISAGMDHSEGAAVINIDSDLQDPPELIPEMVSLWQQGYDVVYAQRSSRRDGLAKRLTAHLFYRILGAMSSVEIPRDTGDFRLLDRRAIDALAKLPEKTRFLRGMVPWLGFRQIALPIERDARAVGESTYTVRKLLCLAIDGLLSFSVAPLYLVPLAGGAMLAVGVAGVLISLLMTGAWHTGQLGGGVILLAMIALTGLQMLCTGILSVYQAKVIDEVRARPTYLVAERVGASFDAKQSTQDNSRQRESLTRAGETV